MKKLLLVLIALFTSTFIYANPPEKTGTLSSKIILQNTQGYFVLSDGSLWKVVGFAKRWRGLSEWWNNVQLVPRNYECVPNDWYLGTILEVHSKHGNLVVNEADASNQEILKQCTHLLTNTKTGQVLFAISLHPVECLVQLFNDAHSDGHTKGFEKGRLESYQNGTQIYNNAYSNGYQVGYREGYQAALHSDQPGS